jgi:hypothetical protein
MGLESISNDCHLDKLKNVYTQYRPDDETYIRGNSF